MADLLICDHVSIHAPRVGSDSSRRRTRPKLSRFNPRSPRGERLEARYQPQCRYLVSIHAPRVGSDRLSKSGAIFEAKFQSTLPAWGATTSDPFWRVALLVSIHAPRVGSDPHRRRGHRRPGVSIHAPRVGSDRGRSGHRASHLVSIHAPRVGSDGAPRACGARSRCFNPRSPRGERRAMLACQTGMPSFQSTLPAWGATFRGHKDAVVRQTFQSTLPAWGATIGAGQSESVLVVSIHAPRVGSDAPAWMKKRRKSVFQSTLPAWGAT